VKRFALLAAMLAVFWASPVVAESLVTEPVIGGSQMRCWDFRGVIVRTLRVTELGDVGYAKIISRMPVILLDKDRLAKLPPKLRIFFYIHECAHHVLGHHYNITTSSESEADCWSVKYGREHGLFSRADVEGFEPYLAPSKGSRYGHLPGLERAAQLLTCFDDPKPVHSAWIN
jgi:hypothetical protein